MVHSEISTAGAFPPPAQKASRLEVQGEEATIPVAEGLRRGSFWGVLSWALSSTGQKADVKTMPCGLFAECIHRKTLWAAAL